MLDGQTVTQKHCHDDATQTICKYAQYGSVREEPDLLLRREPDHRKHRAIHNV